MEIELYKLRGLGGCLQASYNLFNSNIKTIIRKTWLPAVVFSLILACSVLVKLPAGLPMVITPEVQMAYLKFLGGTVALVILSVVALTWLNTHVVSLLNGQSVARNWPRVMRQMLLATGVTLLAGILAAGVWELTLFSAPDKSGPTPQTLNMASALAGLTILVAVIVFIPTVYSTMKYYMEPDQKVMSIFGKPYAQGWRRWGFLFMAGFLTLLIAGLIYVVTQTPVFLVRLSQMADDNGTMMGDPSGLPRHFTALAFAVIFLCNFVWTYVMIWSEMVAYYVYGSIEQKLRERNNNNNIQA